jgi:hypothetical protein
VRLLIVAVASVSGSNCELASFADRVRSSLNFRHDVTAHGVLDVLVAEIDLQRAGVVPLVGHCVAAGVHEHVRASLEAELGSVSGRRRRFLLLFSLYALEYNEPQTLPDRLIGQTQKR